MKEAQSNEQIFESERQGRMITKTQHGNISETRPQTNIVSTQKVFQQNIERDSGIVHTNKHGISESPPKSNIKSQITRTEDFTSEDKEVPFTKDRR